MAANDGGQILIRLRNLLAEKITKFRIWRDDYREHERFRAASGIAVDDLREILMAASPLNTCGALGLYRCKVCGTRWLLWPDVVHRGGWNLLDAQQRPGSCCDNAAMGEQIEHLRDIPLTVVTHGEWQCRYVFPDSKCCRLNIGHDGDHQPAVNAPNVSQMLCDYADLLDLITRTFNPPPDAKFHRGFTTDQIRHAAHFEIDSSRGRAAVEERLDGSPDAKGLAPTRTAADEGRFKSAATPPISGNLKGTVT